MRIALISTYELGRQPFGLASPAAWLRAAGHDVTAIDLARDTLPCETIRDAHLIALYLPMHTATRLALKIVERVQAVNATAQICAYGLYAPLNEEVLRAQGVQTILGGEFEQGLVDVASGLGGPRISLERQRFLVPDRTGLPPLEGYAHLRDATGSRVAGYTEASRGCKHLCRHCPIVPVYQGAFRVVQRDVVLADIRQQVTQGAQHITFGDPDFFNGPAHALAIVQDLHREFPEVSYNVTIKIEHLLKHRRYLPVLRQTGCAFVVSAVESVDDSVLAKLDKGHSRRDFVEAVELMRDTGLPLTPTFVPFTPWTTWDGYRDLLETIFDLDLVDGVAPVQLGIRLLIPNGSLLLELEEVRGLVGDFDPMTLSYPWQNSDPSVDQLCADIQKVRPRESREETFIQICRLAGCGIREIPRVARATVPCLTEPWYC